MNVKIFSLKQLPLLISMLLAGVLLSCRKDKNNPVLRLSFEDSKLELQIGQQKVLKVNGANVEELTWSSSNEKVATVKLGVVTAVAAGETVIKASKGGQSASINVIVNGKATPENYKPYLDLESGSLKLKSLPQLLVPLGSNDEQVKAKEDSYGSTYAGEDTKGNVRRLKFKTNDPMMYNPIRDYVMGDEGMSQMMIIAKTDIFFDGDELNDNLQMLLAKDKFKPIAGDKGIMYSNGTLVYTFAVLNTQKDFCLVMISRDLEAGLVDFNPTANDMPVLDFDLVDKSNDEIRKMVEEKEKAIGRVYDEHFSKVYQGVAFAAPKSEYGKFVLQVVCYKGGDKMHAGITALSYSITNENMLDSKDVLGYFEKNGFTDFSWISSQGYKISKLINKTKGWQVQGAVVASGKQGLFSFIKLPKGFVPDTPPAPKKREKFYMPFLDAFGQEISAESKFVKDEEARGFTAQVKEKTSEDPIRMAVFIPRDAEIPGMSSFYYAPKSGNLDGTTVEEISIMFHPKKNFKPTYNHNGDDDPELKEFLESNGFKYVKSMKSFTLLTFYYNESRDMTLTLMDSPTGLMGTITKGNHVL